MRCFAIGFALMVLLLGSGQAKGAVQVWDAGLGGNGHAYEFVAEPLFWPAAKVAAESRTPPLGFKNGHLVTFSDAAEDNFLIDLFASGPWKDLPAKGAWMGFTDENIEGQWEWIDDTPGIWQDPDNFPSPIQTAYTNWVFGEPNNFLGNQDYAIYNGRGLGVWSDSEGSVQEYRYLVEYDPLPEPSTLIVWSLLAALSIGVGSFRRRRKTS